MTNRHLLALVSVLMAAGLGLFAYKALVLKFPVIPRAEADVWIIEAEVRFKAAGEPVKVTLQVPDNQANFAILSENFISGGYGRKISIGEKTRTRRAIWTIRSAQGDQILYYRTLVTKRARSQERLDTAPPAASPPPLEGIFEKAAKSIMDEVAAKSADLDSTITELMRHLDNPADDENVSVFLGENASVQERMQVAAKLLNFVRIPARVAHGIQVQANRRDIPFLAWLEVFDGAKWLSIDPATGEFGVPEDYFVWWRGDAPPLRVTGGGSAKLNISVSRKLASALDAATQGGMRSKHPLLSFSLLSLPIRTQQVFHAVLLIPVGALLLVIFRNVIGVRTFGTFMPVLIALAFRETTLLAGLSFFVLITALGLSIRFYLSRLKLLLVPRLASMVTIVVLLMAAISVLSLRLDLFSGLSVALFPMVILTMTIERMSITWEELGAQEAIGQGFGSLLIAMACYPVFRSALAEHLIFVFPELLLVVLAATLALGRYTGYRLVELGRFRELEP